MHGWGCSQKRIGLPLFRHTLVDLGRFFFDNFDPKWGSATCWIVQERRTVLKVLSLLVGTSFSNALEASPLLWFMLAGVGFWSVLCLVGAGPAALVGTVPE